MNSPTTPVPPLINPLLSKIHHFRRGVIIATNHQSLDDRLVMRQFFLRSSVSKCIQMTMPAVWRSFVNNVTGDVDFSPIPSAETLCLWDESVLAIDTFDYLFVWSGKATLHQKQDKLRRACISFLLDKSKQRFPSPKLHVLIEGDPMSRKVTTRLAPSHGNTREEQLANFPDLAMLSPDRLNSLRSKFRLYDPESDSTFLHWLSKIAETDSGGETLCC